MEWFRFYHEAVNDPKVQRLTPVLFKHWVNVMCIASMNPERGILPSWSDMAFTLRLTEGKVRAIVSDLEHAGLVDRDGETFRIHAWGKRQKRSDDVTPRVNKHRYGNGGETLQETFHETDSETLPHVRVRETETETETEQNRTDNPQPPKGDELPDEFVEFWSCYPTGYGSKPKSLQAWKKVRREHPEIMAGLEQWHRSERWQNGFIKAAELWLRDRLWENPPPPPKVHANSGNPNPYLNGWKPGSGPAPRKAEDWQLIHDGRKPTWGSANGGLDSL